MGLDQAEQGPGSVRSHVEEHTLLSRIVLSGLLLACGMDD